MKLALTLAVVAMFVFLGWTIFVRIKRHKFTRERFAFVGFTSIMALATAIVAALAAKQTLWGAILSALSELLTSRPVQFDRPRVSDGILMVAILVIVARLLQNLFRHWDGALSVRQHEKEKYRETAAFASEALWELRRILKRQPVNLYTESVSAVDIHALSPPQTTYAWHEQARGLLLLKFPSFEIDRYSGWHSEERCWIGFNKHTLQPVAVRCGLTDPSVEEIDRFLEYAHRVVPFSQGGEIDLLLAIKSGPGPDRVQSRGGAIRIERELSLLDGIVDFSDYYGDLLHKVDVHRLPDSDLVLGQVYVPPACITEGNQQQSFDLEEYVFNWLEEPGMRHLALLGEYGQGKSTASLMIAYKIVIKHARHPPRVPVIIELRGRSPRHMSPEELLASWAVPYRISAQALMKLLIAGRLLIILEGFDEMALFGGSETRLQHFRTLWKLAFPASKLLLTGRPNYFLDDRELKTALGIAKGVAAGPYCEAVLLQPLTIDQIRGALRAYARKTREEIVACARSEHKFYDLVSRASLLFVVSHLWVREKLSEQQARISSAFVIDLFMRHSFQRQTVKHDESRDFMILTEPERRYFMSGIAAYMGAMGFPNQLTREHLDRSVRLLYEVIPSSVSSAGIGAPMESRMPLRLRLEGSDEPLQDIANDVRACGILVADQSRSGTFRFAHRSFLECLLASVLKDRILGFDKEATGAIIAATGLTTYDVARSQESLRFLAELLIDEAASPPSKETENPTVRAKRLFNVIVIRQMRPNFGKRIRATIGVWTMIARARQHDEVSGLPRFVIGWSMDPVGLPVTISILLSMPLLLSAAIRVSSVEMWIASVFIGMTFIVFGSATLLSRLSETNLQLWYACCASIGLAEQEIGAIIGLKWLSQVRYYVQDTFDRHTRHDNR